MTWQPIETAPKDGTIIDLWVDGDRCVDCRWYEGNKLHPEPGWYDYSLDYGNGDWIDLDDKVTHWQPLPAPPEALPPLHGDGI